MGTQGGQVGGGTEMESNEESYLDRGSHYEGGQGETWSWGNPQESTRMIPIKTFSNNEEGEEGEEGERVPDLPSSVIKLVTPLYVITEPTSSN